jgi:diguanylate cyclase (GGDEF)-like protein
MIGLLGILLIGALLLLYVQHRATRLLRAENRELHEQVRTVTELPTVVSGTDWQRSVQDLTDTLVRSGVTTAAALLAPIDNGNIEVRAWAAADGAPYGEGLPEAICQRVLTSRTPARCDTGDLLLPVMEDGEPLGILAVRGGVRESPPLRVAVGLAGLVLSGIRSTQRQSALSSTDGLTGLANHRHFQQMLGIALGQSYLEGEPLSVILLDIDHFKTINDSHGHLLGDLVLREIAYLLRRELPPGALAARYGGEELVIILQGQMATEAGAVAERLRESIAGHQVFDFTTGAKLAVTVSLGVAAYELGQGKSRLINRADEAMYTSKREGRNRVTVAPPENGTDHLFPS